MGEPPGPDLRACPLSLTSPCGSDPGHGLGECGRVLPQANQWLSGEPSSLLGELVPQSQWPPDAISFEGDADQSDGIVAEFVWMLPEIPEDLCNGLGLSGDGTVYLHRWPLWVLRCGEAVHRRLPKEVGDDADQPKTLCGGSGTE
jgi:hypothetical protein